jgi:hypothetical protein
MEKADVPDEIKMAWLKNRLTRLCHNNPSLLPYYLQIVNDDTAIRKLYSMMEVERLEEDK